MVENGRSCLKLDVLKRLKVLRRTQSLKVKLVSILAAHSNDRLNVVLIWVICGWTVYRYDRPLSISVSRWLRIDHVPLNWKLNWNNSASPAYSNRHTPSLSEIKIIHRAVYPEWALSQTQPNISNLGFPGFGKNLWVKIIWKTSRSLSSNHFSDSVTKSSYLGMISFWARSNSGTHSRTAQTRAVSSGTVLAFLKTHVFNTKIT